MSGLDEVLIADGVLIEELVSSFTDFRSAYFTGGRLITLQALGTAQTEELRDQCVAKRSGALELFLFGEQFEGFSAGHDDGSDLIRWLPRGMSSRGQFVTQAVVQGWPVRDARCGAERDHFVRLRLHGEGGHTVIVPGRTRTQQVMVPDHVAESNSQSRCREEARDDFERRQCDGIRRTRTETQTATSARVVTLRNLEALASYPQDPGPAGQPEIATVTFTHPSACLDEQAEERRTGGQVILDRQVRRGHQPVTVTFELAPDPPDPQIRIEAGPGNQTTIPLYSNRLHFALVTPGSYTPGVVRVTAWTRPDRADRLETTLNITRPLGLLGCGSRHLEYGILPVPLLRLPLPRDYELTTINDFGDVAGLHGGLPFRALRGSEPELVGLRSQADCVLAPTMSSQGDLAGTTVADDGTVTGVLIAAGAGTVQQIPDVVFSVCNELGHAGGYRMVEYQRLAAVFKKGTFVELAVPGAKESAVTAINARGDVAGWLLDDAGNQHAFAVRGEKLVVLPVPDGGPASATGINESGMIVGVTPTEGNQVRAFLVTSDGEMHDIGQLWPVGISDSGVVAGTAWNDDDRSTVAVRWTSDGGLEPLDDVTGGDAPPLEDVRAVSAGGTILATTGSSDDLYVLLRPQLPT